MKKFTAMLLTLCFTLMIVGCSEETKTTKKVETKTTATDTKKP
jgi:PBP1b-binding outer membrane lipoprotein LpoB